MMAASLRLPCVLVPLARERLFLHRTYRIVAALPDAPRRAWLCANQGQKIIVVETGVGGEAAARAVEWLLARPRHDGL
ncbi:MAG: hypothetical protein NZO58_10025, partial [Gemmataceae bacterium]|nr:hypothetical protein [Gemmataceae bacterium]